MHKYIFSGGEGGRGRGEGVGGEEELVLLSSAVVLNPQLHAMQAELDLDVPLKIKKSYIGTCRTWRTGVCRYVVLCTVPLLYPSQVSWNCSSLGKD